MILTTAALLGALEQGMIYAILALGVFLSFRTLNTPDLTVDGSIVTGAVISASICSAGGNTVLALLLSFAGGATAGAVTALLNIKLKIEPLLAGILVMLGLYSINLRILQDRANVALTQSSTIYKQFKEAFGGDHSAILLGSALLLVITLLFYLFLNTRLGFALRATGDNEYMVRASGVNSNSMKLMGLALSNGFVGLAGGMLAQYQSFADVGMGTGMVVIGLASVIIGETIFEVFSKNLPLLAKLLAVSVGAVIYRIVLAVALNLGLPSNDFKLISAIIVAIALSTNVIGDYFPKRIDLAALRKENSDHAAN